MIGNYNRNLIRVVRISHNFNIFGRSFSIGKHYLVVVKTTLPITMSPVLHYSNSRWYSIFLFVDLHGSLCDFTFAHTWIACSHVPFFVYDIFLSSVISRGFWHCCRNVRPPEQNQGAPRRQPQDFSSRRLMYTIAITGIAVLLGSFFFQRKSNHNQVQ